MIKVKHARKTILNVNRRRFMVGAAGFTFGVALGAPAAFRIGGGEAHAAGKDVVVNPWVTISTDGTVAIMSPAAEMGQGSLTSLPLILAEELDADWSRVRVVPAPPDEQLYGNPGFGGIMYTAGSFTVNGYFKSLRIFGAQVRLVLLENAARHWSVPLAELATLPGVVRQLLQPLSGKVMPVDDYLNDFMNGCPYKDNFYRMMYYHTKLTLPEDMLTKVDRMSMAYSLEARVPFLDHRLIEFMAHVHKDVKMQGYERKSVLRRTVGRALPKSILSASKKGFVVPLREWFKDRSLTASLPNYLAQTPLDMNRGLVDGVLAKNASGQADYGNFIWMLFLLGKWFRV